MEASLEEVKELTMSRTKFYSFLSRIYREEVDQELLEHMKHRSTSIAIDDPEMAREYDKLRTFLERIEINKEFIEDLAADYASLFLGIGRYPAHPYESVYQSKEGIVMREPRNEVLRIYHREGLQKVECFKEPDDHVAIELEFMAYLCLKMKETLDRQDIEEGLRLLEFQNDFLSKHLKAWVPQFCDDIIKGSSKYDFYKTIGEITKRYIVLEERTVVQLTKELKNHKVIN